MFGPRDDLPVYLHRHPDWAKPEVQEQIPDGDWGSQGLY